MNSDIEKDQTAERKSFRRRNFFSKKRVQIHFAVAATILLLVSMCGIWLIMNFFFHSYLADQMLLTDSGRLFYEHSNYAILAYILTNGVFIFSLLIYFSHYIAGPLHHIDTVLQEVIDGKPFRDITLRQYDLLHDTADLINTVVHKLQHRKK